eukprot:EG_transcript_6217
MDTRTVGVLGGGQLGRMMAKAGLRLGLRIAVLDPGGVKSPAGQVTPVAIEGSFSDPAKIQELAAISDVLTTEIEHVNVDVLEELENAGKVVHPNSQTLRLIQDKYTQKVHLAKHGLPVPDFVSTPTLEAAREAGAKFGYPLMLKNRRLAYDGRGNSVAKTAEDLPRAFAALGGADVFAERWAPFVKELAVMVAHSATGEVVSYPVVESVQQNNVCHLVTAPARISPTARHNATQLALKAIASFEGVGIYGVEMFLMPDDSVLINEIAPRPHNSGHYTIEACEIDQFEMHLRAVLGLACPPPRMKVGAAMMVNLLGQDNTFRYTMTKAREFMCKASAVPGAGLHWYGKTECTRGRKMAHVTVTADNFAMLKERVELLGLPADVHGLQSAGPRVAVIMGSDSDLPTMQDAAKVLADFGVPYELTVVSAHRTPARMYAYAQAAADRGIQVIIAGAGGAAHLPGMVAALTSLPVVGVPIKSSTLSGNDSLLSIVQMPKGIPVATVAIGNAANAGLLAVRILAAQDRELLHKMDAFLKQQEAEVLEKAERLEAVGYQAYLNSK